MRTTFDSWTKEDFLTYILLYAANADFTISKEEKQFILNKVDVDEYEKIHRIFQKHSEHQRSETVRLLGQQYCNDPSNKCEIRKEIIKLFFADDDYSILEKNFFIGIKKILNLNE
ncbi:MAG: hypothetical protein R2764_14875 [Bacteroidales bacterium]